MQSPDCTASIVQYDSPLVNVQFHRFESHLTNLHLQLAAKCGHIVQYDSSLVNVQFHRIETHLTNSRGSSSHLSGFISVIFMFKIKTVPRVCLCVRNMIDICVCIDISYAHTSIRTF